MGYSGSRTRAAQAAQAAQASQPQAQPQEAAAVPAAVNVKSAPVKPSAWKSFTAQVGGAMATVGTGISTAATWLASTYTGWGIIALGVVALLYVAYDSSKASESSTKPTKSSDLKKGAPRAKDGENKENKLAQGFDLTPSI